MKTSLNSTNRFSGLTLSSSRGVFEEPCNPTIRDLRCAVTGRDDHPRRRNQPVGAGSIKFKRGRCRAGII
jgi:hypothetical protein